MKKPAAIGTNQMAPQCQKPHKKNHDKRGKAVKCWETEKGNSSKSRGNSERKSRGTNKGNGSMSNVWELDGNLRESLCSPL